MNSSCTMRKIEENTPETSCRYTNQREFTPVPHHPQAMNSQNASARGLRFTPDMLRDQEMLVSTMSQQGISEDLIRRQFERLLEEQSKQLRLIKEETLTEKVDPAKMEEMKKCPKAQEDVTQLSNVPPEGCYAAPPCSHQHANHFEVCKVNHCQETVNQQQQPPVPEEIPEKTNPTNSSSEKAPIPKIEPISLLKIRLKKEVLNASKRNNGLQEASTALKIIKDSKSKIAQDRHTAEQDGMARLNGTQERSLGEQAQLYHMAEAEKQRRVASANGLENSRNFDNPPYHMRYPPHFPAATQAVTPNSTHSEPHPSAQTIPANAHHEQPTSQQTQQTYKPQNPNNSELQEPRVIGGFTYLARKPYCSPRIPNQTNNQIYSQTKPTTAL